MRMVAFWSQYVEAHPDSLDLAYENPHFSLYRIRAPAEAAAASLSH